MESQNLIPTTPAMTNITSGIVGPNEHYSRMFSNIPRYMYKELPTVTHSLGVIFNIILIIYFLKAKKYTSPTFALLTQLAFADCLCCAAGVGYASVLFPFMSPSISKSICPIFVFIAKFAVNLSEYYLVFFAGLRFYQLAFPLAAQVRVTSGFVMRGCFIVQVLSVLYVAPFIYFYRAIDIVFHGRKVTLCGFIGDSYTKNILFDVFNSIIPCCSILIFHTAKYIALSYSQSSRYVQNERNNADARAVTIVICLFFLSWMPAHTYTMIQQSRVDNYITIDDNLFLVLMHIIFISSTIDPLVYCFAAKTVRNDIIKLFSRKKEQRKHSKLDFMKT